METSKILIMKIFDALRRKESGEKHILFVGPMPPPLHGQSFVFAETFKIFSFSRPFLVNVNVSGTSFPRLLCVTVKGVVKLVLYLLTKKISVVYFTCSRSLKGSLFDIVVIALSHMAGAKLVNHIHGSDFKSFYDSCPRLYRMVIDTLYKKIDVSIVPMKGIERQISGLFPEMHVATVHNFVSDDITCSDKKTISNSVKLLFLSNIMISKGIVELFDAFSLVARERSDITLTIAGEIYGDRYLSREKMKDVFFRRFKIIDRDTGGRIEYRGFVGGNEKVGLLCSADILVLPSYNEALPLAVVEGMRAANAIIATRTLYLDDYISDSEGMLVPIGNVDELTRAIRFLLENQSILRRIQQHNQAYAHTFFSMTKYKNDMISIFNDL